MKKTGLKIKLYGAIILGLMILPMFFGVARAQTLHEQLTRDIFQSVENASLRQTHPDIMPFLRANPNAIVELRVATTHDTFVMIGNQGINLGFHSTIFPAPISIRWEENGVRVYSFPARAILDGTWYSPTFELTHIRFDRGHIYGTTNPLDFINGEITFYGLDGWPISTLMQDTFFSYRIIMPMPVVPVHEIEITHPVVNSIHQSLDTSVIRYSAPSGPDLQYYKRIFFSRDPLVSGTNYEIKATKQGHEFRLGGENVHVAIPLPVNIVGVANWHAVAYLFRYSHIPVYTETLVDISPVVTFTITGIPDLPPAGPPAPPAGWTPPAVTPIPTAPDIIAGLPTILQPIAETVNEMIGGLGNLFNSFVSNITARFPFSWILGIRDVINQEAQDAVDVIRYPTLNITLPAFGDVASSKVDMLPITALMTSTHIMGQPNQFPTIVTIFRNILLFSSWILFSLFIIKRVRSFVTKLGTAERN